MVSSYLCHYAVILHISLVSHGLRWNSNVGNWRVRLILESATERIMPGIYAGLEWPIAASSECGKGSRSGWYCGNLQGKEWKEFAVSLQISNIWYLWLFHVMVRSNNYDYKRMFVGGDLGRHVSWNDAIAYTWIKQVQSYSCIASLILV